jgi:hypothetical protein
LKIPKLASKTSPEPLGKKFLMGRRMDWRNTDQREPESLRLFLDGKTDGIAIWESFGGHGLDPILITQSR